MLTRLPSLRDKIEAQAKKQMELEKEALEGEDDKIVKLPKKGSNKKPRNNNEH